MLTDAFDTIKFEENPLDSILILKYLYNARDVLLSVADLKYGKPIWQLVAEAADRLKIEVLTFSDIIKEVHQLNPDVPEISIRSYVMAMAPNHSFSGHWPSARKNHPYFYYLGNGKFKRLT